MLKPKARDHNKWNTAEPSVIAHICGPIFLMQLHCHMSQIDRANILVTNDPKNKPPRAAEDAVVDVAKGGEDLEVGGRAAQGLDVDPPLLRGGAAFQSRALKNGPLLLRDGTQQLSWSESAWSWSRSVCLER